MVYFVVFQKRFRWSLNSAKPGRTFLAYARDLHGPFSLKKSLYTTENYSDDVDELWQAIELQKYVQNTVLRICSGCFICTCIQDKGIPTKQNLSNR